MIFTDMETLLPATYNTAAHLKQAAAGWRQRRQALASVATHTVRMRRVKLGGGGGIAALGQRAGGLQGTGLPVPLQLGHECHGSPPEETRGCDSTVATFCAHQRCYTTTSTALGLSQPGKPGLHLHAMPRYVQL